MTRIRYIVFFLLVTSYSSVRAQQNTCDAKTFFENNNCSFSSQGLKCVELDISHTLDKEGKEFIYAWNFGDGHVKNGYLTEYCYENFGTYVISLDLLDPKTKLVIRNELTTTVKLLPPIDYSTDTVNQSSFNLLYDPNLIPGVVVDKVFWKIEDTFSCGKTTHHTFSKEGFHLLVVGISGKLEGKDFLGCTLMGVFIDTKK